MTNQRPFSLEVFAARFDNIRNKPYSLYDGHDDIPIAPMIFQPYCFRRI